MTVQQSNNQDAEISRSIQRRQMAGRFSTAIRPYLRQYAGGDEAQAITSIEGTVTTDATSADQYVQISWVKTLTGDHDDSDIEARNLFDQDWSTGDKVVAWKEDGTKEGGTPTPGTDTDDLVANSYNKDLVTDTADDDLTEAPADPEDEWWCFKPEGAGSQPKIFRTKEDITQATFNTETGLLTAGFGQAEGYRQQGGAGFILEPDPALLDVTIRTWRTANPIKAGRFVVCQGFYDAWYVVHQDAPVWNFSPMETSGPHTFTVTGNDVEVKLATWGFTNAELGDPTAAAYPDSESANHTGTQCP